MRERRPIGHFPKLIAAILLAGCGNQGAQTEEHPAPPRHLVVISIDTLRADRLGCYGYTRDTSPNLDRFADNSLVYRSITSAAPSTAPSHMSMLTGVYPPVHGVHNVALDANQKNRRAEDTQIPLAPSTLPTLAETLQEAGFVTAAFTDSGYLTEDFRFDRGFSLFDSEAEGITEKVDRTLEWLEQADTDHPTFLFFHTYQVHAPYAPPIAFDRFSNPRYAGSLRQRVEEIRQATKEGGLRHAQKFLPGARETSPADLAFLSDLYDGEILYTDSQIERLLKVLREPPWAGKTAILITSDHGEAFLEHGMLGHGSLFDTDLHVPFILHAPGRKPAVIQTPASGVDTTPTLLDLLGLPLPYLCDGQSLLGPIDPDRPLLNYRGKPGLWAVAARQNLTKVMRELRQEKWDRFDLSVDPGEQTTLTPTDPEHKTLVRFAEQSLETHLEIGATLRASSKTDSSTLSEDTIERLIELGYVR
ncbi:MAG: sulfatase [Planctomycetota bacterium]|nr:sulfatase [Planctomycetota bacterium]